MVLPLVRKWGSDPDVRTRVSLSFYYSRLQLLHSILAGLVDLLPLGLGRDSFSSHPVLGLVVVYGSKLNKRERGFSPAPSPPWRAGSHPSVLDLKQTSLLR
jgi:hypothetical protein